MKHFNYNKEQLEQLDYQYRIMRKESEKPFDFIVSDIVVKLIEDINARDNESK